MEKINRKDQWASNIVIFMMIYASITLSLAVAFEVYLLKRFLYGSYLTIGLIFFLVTVGLYVVKTKNYKLPSYIVILFCFPLIVFRAVHSGQLSSPFMIYLPILPVMSYYVFNKRFGHYIVGMCFVSLFLIAKYDVFFPFVESERITFEGLAEVAHGIASIGIITFFSLIFEKRTQLLNNELEVEQELLEGVNTNIPGIVYRAKYVSAIGIEIVYMNKQVDNIIGVSREKYINKNILHWRENIIIDDLKKVITKQREALDKKQNYEIAYRIKDKEGRTLHMNEKGNVVEDPSTGFIHLDAIIMDLTSQIKLEEEVDRQFLEIMQTKNKLESALEGANLGTWEWHVKEDRVVNDFRFLKMIGREKDLTTEDWESFLHKEDISRFKNIISDVVEGQTELINQNFRIKHKDGHYLFMKARGTVSEKDKDGNVVLLIGTYLDITEAEEAKMEIEESRKQLFNMIQLLPVAVCMLDNNMNYLAHSLAWNKFIIENNELPLFENFKENSPFLFDHFNKHIDKAKKGEIVKDNEDYVVLENFESKYFEWEIRPWRNAVGDIEGILLMINDITERKEYEKIVSQSARMSALGEMAGGIAHEINNPLNIIGGYATIIRKGIEKGDREKPRIYLEKIENTVQRIAKIVKGMKNFSRDGSTDPFEITSSRALIEESLELCSERFKNNEVELQVKLESEADIVCRPVEISQVLLNIINNAFQAVTKNEKKWVRVELFEEDRYVIYSIIDSGKGIPKEVINKIFEPFYTTKEVGVGTGLGLSIAKGIIEVHKGEMYYDDSCDNTKFVIKLPKA